MTWYGGVVGEWKERDIVEGKGAGGVGRVLTAGFLSRGYFPGGIVTTLVSLPTKSSLPSSLSE